MKHRSSILGASVIITALALPSLSASPGSGQGQNNSDTLPITPVGSLTATPTVVQTGTLPTLDWSIVYPSKVGDVATIVPPGTIQLKEQMYLQVRAVGVGVTDNPNTGTVNNTPAEIRISINGGGYEQLFYGTNEEVDPTHSLYVKKLNPGTTINFGGRYVKDQAWTSFYTTRSSNMQMIALADGDIIPTSFDLTQSDLVAEFLKPYVDSAGKVDIGPLSVLILAEYGSDLHSSPSFDYQDFALLVTLSTKNNNGHGNNIDGVDSSNPGNGSGGPNGTEDPSGGVDDEK